MGHDKFDMWCRRPGKNLTTCKALLVSDYDVAQLIKGRDQMSIATLYISTPFNFVSSSTSTSRIDKKRNLRASKNLNPQFAEPFEVPYSASFQSPTLTSNPTTLRKSPKKTLITESVSLSKNNNSQQAIVSQPLSVKPVLNPTTSHSPARPQKLVTSRQLNFSNTLPKVGMIGSSEVVDREETVEAEFGLQTDVNETGPVRKKDEEKGKGAAVVVEDVNWEGKLRKKVVEDEDVEFSDSELSDTGYLSPVEEGDEDKADNPDLQLMSKKMFLMK